jgi:hypothetical protein
MSNNSSHGADKCIGQMTVNEACQHFSGEPLIGASLPALQFQLFLPPSDASVGQSDEQ